MNMCRFFWILIPLFAALLTPTSAWEASVSHNHRITTTTEEVSFSPTSLTFASQITGTSSAAQTVTMTNTGNVSFPLSSIAITGTNAGDFAETNNCPSSLAVSAACQIAVTFAPAATGAMTASLVVSATGGVTYTVPLSATSIANPTGTSTANPTDALSATFFGMHIEAAADWPGSPTIIGAAGKCGGSTWPYLETTRGVSQYYSSDCTNSTYCSAAGIPKWSSCANLATDYAAFFTQLVSRYGTQLIYELWNEPESAVNGYGGGCSVAQLVAAVNAAYSAGVAVAPTAIFNAPSFGPSLGNAFYSNGGTQAFSNNTFHNYTDGIEGVGTTPEGMVTAYNQMESAISGFPTMAAKSMWMSEGAAYTSYPGGAGIPAQPVMAAYVARFYLLLWSVGVPATYWYAWDDPEFGPIMGYPEVVTAFDETETWMIGSSNPVMAVNGTVYTVSMTQSAGNRAQAVWNTAGSSSYTVPSGYGHYTNLSGSTSAISGGTVTIGVSPILLTP
jgi:hypothetical protein